VYGVFSDKYIVPLAKIFGRTGYSRVMVLNGLDGLDEISNVGVTSIAELKDREVVSYTVTPEDLGVPRATPSDIETLNSEEQDLLNSAQTLQAEKDHILAEGRSRNIRTFLRVLYGQEKGPKRDIAVINAGAALYLGEKAGSLKDGVTLAGSLVDSGSAQRKVEELAGFFDEREALAKCKREAGI